MNEALKVLCTVWNHEILWRIEETLEIKSFTQPSRQPSAH